MQFEYRWLMWKMLMNAAMKESSVYAIGTPVASVETRRAELNFARPSLDYAEMLGLNLDCGLS